MKIWTLSEFSMILFWWFDFFGIACFLICVFICLIKWVTYVGWELRYHTGYAFFFLALPKRENRKESKFKIIAIDNTVHKKLDTIPDWAN